MLIIFIIFLPQGVLGAILERFSKKDSQPAMPPGGAKVQQE
jgi:hypothetical protein